MLDSRPVCFYLPGEKDLAALQDIRPEETWRDFVVGPRAWILQTYLLLRQRGIDIELVDEPRRKSILIFHAAHRRYLTQARPSPDTLLVAIRGDRREVHVADLEILQNDRFHDGVSRFAIPHWPQPGLRPRNPARGSAIRTIAYKGFEKNLDSAFLSREWHEFLLSRGLTWRYDAIPFDDWPKRSNGINWPDFNDIDLVLAVRPPQSRMITEKPAAKLLNAWVAGTPALLGSEYGFRALRQSPLDFIEIETIDQARNAIDRLLSTPTLYTEMIENGLRRAQEFTVDRIADKWQTLLFETIPSAPAARRTMRFRGIPLWFKKTFFQIERIVAQRPIR